MANAAQVLQQAHDLIEAGDYQAARQILDTVRSSNENNPDFWWVYAHAVEDATEGKAAIDRVRQLAPNYAGLETIVGGSPQTSGGIKPLRPLAPLPPRETVDEEDEFAETGTETEEKRPNYLMQILAVFLLILIIGGVLGVSLGGLFNTGVTATPEPTGIVDNFTPLVPTSDSQVVTTEEVSTEEVVASEEASTEEVANTEEVTESEAAPTEEIAASEEASTEEVASTVAVSTEEVVETEEAPTQESAAEETEVADTTLTGEVIEDLGEFGVPEEGGITEEDSSLGQTLTVTSCAVPGPMASQNILGILDAFKAAGVDLQAEAISFNISDCTTDTVLLSLGVSSEIVESYWLGDTTGSELLAALRRL